MAELLCLFVFEFNLGHEMLNIFACLFFLPFCAKFLSSTCTILVGIVGSPFRFSI